MESGNDLADRFGHKFDHPLRGAYATKPAIDTAKIGEGSGDFCRSAAIGVEQFAGRYPLH